MLRTITRITISNKFSIKRFYANRATTLLNNVRKSLTDSVPNKVTTVTADVVKNLSDTTQMVKERIEPKVMDTINTVAYTRKILRVTFYLIVICGTLFAIGIAADSIAKIFESYDRIKKVTNKSFDE